MNILVITLSPGHWEKPLAFLEGRGIEVSLSNSWDEGLARIPGAGTAAGTGVVRPDLVILDLDLDAQGLREHVIKVLERDVFIHTAAVSAMDPDTFHDAMEGLGMLGSLPQEPSARDLEGLLEALAKLGVA